MVLAYGIEYYELHHAYGSTRPSYRGGGETVTAPYSYDGMLDLGPGEGAKYICAKCESVFDDDCYLCPTCGSLTIERRLPSAES